MSANVKFDHLKNIYIPAQAQLPRTTLIQHYVSYLTPLSVVQPTNIKWLSLKLGDTRNL